MQCKISQVSASSWLPLKEETSRSGSDDLSLRRTPLLELSLGALSGCAQARLVLKCGLAHLNANARDESNANVQKLNQMQMHLDKMQMHLDQMQMFFYKYVFFCVQQVICCLFS